MNKTLNFKYLVRFLAIIGVFVVAVWVVHRAQAGKVTDAFLRQADAAEQEEDLTRTASYLRRFLVMRPNDADVRARLALLLEDAGQSSNEALNQALDQMETVLRIDPNRNEIRRHRIDVELKLGNLADATRHLDDLARTEEKNNGELYDLKGQCLVATEKYVEASEAFVEAIKAKPSYVFAFGRLAMLIRHQLRGDPNAWLAISKKLEIIPWWIGSPELVSERTIKLMVKENPDSASAHLVAAGFWKDSADFKKSAEEINSALKCDPHDPEVILAAADLANTEASERDEKGDSIGSKKKIAEACALLDQGIKTRLSEIAIKTTRENRKQLTRLKAQVAAMFAQLANFQVRLNKLAEAEATARLGVDRLPQFPELRLQLADVYIAQGHGNEAEAQLDTLKGLNAKPWIIALRRGRIEIVKGNWPGAVTKLEEAAAAANVAPGPNREIWNLLEKCYAQTGMPDRLLDVYRRAVPKDSGDKSWLPMSMGEAAALVQLGRTAEAKEIYEQIVSEKFGPEKDQRFTGANIPLARLLLAELSQSPKGNEQLSARIEALIKDAPKDINRELFSASFLLSKGNSRLKEARKVLTDACKDFPTRVEPWVELAFLESRQKESERIEQPEEVLKKAEDKFGNQVALTRLVRAQMIVNDSGNGKNNVANLGTEFEKLAEGSDQFKNKEERQRLLRGLAQIAQAAGARDVADLYWDQLAKEWPGYLPYHLIRFDNAVQSNNQGRIEQTIGEINKIDAKFMGRLVQEALYPIWKARHLHDPSDLETAAKTLSELEGMRPGWSRIAVAQGTILDLQNKGNLALERYRRAIDLGERNREVIWRAIALCYKQKQFDLAKQLMLVLKQEPQFAKGHELLGMVLSAQARDFSTALQLAEADAKKNPTNYQSWLRLSQIRELWNKQDSAKKPLDVKGPLDAAIKQQPLEPDAWLMLVRYYKDRKLVDDAEKTIQESQKQIRESDRPLALAQCYEIIGDSKNARACFEKLIKADGNNLSVIRSYANFCMQTGDRDDRDRALQLAERALKVSASKPEDMAFAYRILAIVLSTKADFQQALGALQKIPGILDDQGNVKPVDASDTQEMVQTRALALGLQSEPRRKHEAINLLIEYRRKNGSLSEENQLLLAQLYMMVSKAPQAQGILRTLVDADRDNLIYVYLYADGLIKQGSFPEAELQVQQLEKSHPDSFRTIELRARLFAARDGVDRAASYLTSQADKLVAKSDTPSDQVKAVAILLEQVGAGAAAERYYKQIVDKDSRPEAPLILAQYYGRQGDLAKAMDKCEKVWNDPKAKREIVCGAYVAALYSVQHPSSEMLDLAYQRVESSMKMNRSPALVNCAAALRNLQGSLPGNPKDQNRYYHEAIELYGEIAAHNASSVEEILTALNNRAFLLSASEHNHEGALGILEQARKKGGAITTLLDTEAQVYIAKADSESLEKAISLLNQVIQLEPSGSHYFHLAQALDKLKRTGMATAAMKKALDLKLKESDLHPLERPEFQKLKQKLMPENG